MLIYTYFKARSYLNDTYSYIKYLLNWTGHLAFVRKHAEVKETEEGYEVECPPESQEVSSTGQASM